MWSNVIIVEQCCPEMKCLLTWKTTMGSFIRICVDLQDLISVLSAKEPWKLRNNSRLIGKLIVTLCHVKVNFELFEFRCPKTYKSMKQEKSLNCQTRISPKQVDLKVHIKNRKNSNSRTKVSNGKPGGKS